MSYLEPFVIVYDEYLNTSDIKNYNSFAFSITNKSFFMFTVKEIELISKCLNCAITEFNIPKYSICVELTENMYSYELASTTMYNRLPIINLFMNNIKSYEELVESIFHEAVHAKQALDMRFIVKENSIIFDNKEYKGIGLTVEEYISSPWEIEAFDFSLNAMQRFDRNLIPYCEKRKTFIENLSNKKHEGRFAQNGY
jgi:hypothetical protein